MGKLNFYVYLILQFYPIHEICENITHMKITWHVGVRVLLAAGGPVATIGQLLFAPWAWAYSTVYPLWVGR